MKNDSLRLVLALLAAVLVVACGGGEPETAAPGEPAAAPAAAVETAVGGGAVQGVVTYNNGDPDTEIKMDADPVCQGLHEEAVYTQKIVTDDQGRLANVFVYVKQGASGGGPAPAEPHVLDQKGCQYFPRVSGMVVGQKLIIRNSDPTLHNVHALPKKNAEFNQGQPFQGMEIEKSFDQVEVMVPFKCDVHPWMASYMAVLDHPYFGVSGVDGSFSIDDLPAGAYVLEAWHEELGAQTQEITVTDGETISVNFDFQPKA